MQLLKMAILFSMAFVASCTVTEPCVHEEKWPFEIKLNYAKGTIYVKDQTARQIYVISDQTQNVEGSVQFQGIPIDFDFTHDGKYGYLLLDNGDVSIFETTSNRITKTHHTGIEGLVSILISKTGDYIYLLQGGINGKFYVLNSNNYQVKNSLVVGSNSEKIVLSKNGKYVFVQNTDFSVDIFEMEGMSVVGAVVADGRKPGVTVSDDDDYVYLSSAGSVNRPGSFEKIKIRGLQKEHKLAFTNGVKQALYKEDGNRFYVLEAGGNKLFVVDKEKYVVVQNYDFDSYAIEGMTFNKNKTKIYAIDYRSSDHPIMIFDPETGRIIQKIELYRHDESVGCSL